MSFKRYIACGFILLLVLFCFSGCSTKRKAEVKNNTKVENKKVPTKKIKREDYIEAIGDVKDALDNMPGVNETLSKKDRDRLFASLISDIKEDKLDDLSIYYRIKRITAAIKCSHLQYAYEKENPDDNVIPLTFQWMGDKLIIYNANNKKYLGCSVKTINGMSNKEYNKRFVAIKSCETAAGEKACIDNRKIFVNDLVQLEIMRENDTKINLSVENLDGTKEDIQLKMCKNSEYQKPYSLLDMKNAPKEPPMSYKVSDASHYANYAYQEDQKNKTMYFQYLSCEEIDTLPMDQFFAEMINKMKKNDGVYKTFVIDVRWNQGGYRTVLQDQLKKYQKYLNSKKIAVITGGNTYSAGAQVVEDALTMFDHAKIYGGPTGQAIHNYTEVSEYEVGKIGTILVVPTVKDSLPTLVNRFGDIKESIKPDVEVYQTIEDYIKGIDSIYQAIITDK